MPADHGVQCYEDCHPSALSSIDEPSHAKWMVLMSPSVTTLNRFVPLAMCSDKTRNSSGGSGTEALLLARILTKPAMVTGSSSSPIKIRSLPLLLCVSRSYSAVVYLLEYLEVWILGTSPYLRVLGDGGCC